MLPQERTREDDIKRSYGGTYGIKNIKNAATIEHTASVQNKALPALINAATKTLSAPKNAGQSLGSLNRNGEGEEKTEKRRDCGNGRLR